MSCFRTLLEQLKKMGAPNPRDARHRRSMTKYEPAIAEPSEAINRYDFGARKRGGSTARGQRIWAAG